MGISVRRFYKPNNQKLDKSCVQLEKSINVFSFVPKGENTTPPLDYIVHEKIYVQHNNSYLYHHES